MCGPLTELSVIRHEPDNRYLVVITATLRTDMLRERPARVKAPLRRFAALTRTGRSRLPGTYRSVAQE